ncbi:MAG TPA: hypothetical protein VEC37_18060, partial [Bacillota bacterium]|nr:hypothetical protein [Bacillota bacterium]
HPLSQDEIRNIRSLRNEIISIRPVLNDSSVDTSMEENRLAKPLKELFEDYYKFKTGAAPRLELTGVFMEIAAAGEEESDQ